MNTPLGRLTCERVLAKATSRLGSSILTIYYHPQYGFVQLNYQNINGSFTELKLLSAGSTNELPQAALLPHTF
ncbi:hypothetical protein [Hymenobacter wooponensis]|uniref:Uncharacterized protein n=1 Tax=Hymenobacter wooponensis TaxID=1525360 RepID=A0A4Z0MIN0_9BACT|nr:hypothetical protein [Hymenobacter wooponensis]TGD79371.1 hypothetical protein EU557_14140 [Hymenobacter wooponensis]